MPLFDKVKAQASQVAAKAQEAGKAGHEKIEQAQAKRDGDALLRRLGAAVYAQRTGHAEGAEDVDELIAAITTHEAEHGSIARADKAEAAPADSTAGETPAGDFKL